MASLHRIVSVGQRVLTQIGRDRRTVGFLLIFPLVFVFLFGFAFGGEVNNVKTAYINDDLPITGLRFSEDLLTRLDADDRVILTNVTGTLSFEQAEAAVRSGRYSAVIYFEPDLTKNLLTARRGLPSQTSRIQVFSDNTNPQIAAAVAQAIHDAVSNILGSTAGLNIKFSKMLDVDLRQVDYFAPGIIGFGVMVMTLILSLMIMIRERKEGTLGRVLTTRATRTDLVLGYLLGFGLLGLIVGTVVLAGVSVFFNVVIQGSYLLVYLIVIIFAGSSIGLGIMLSAFARNEFQAVQFIPPIMFISIFLSDLLIPIESMPTWLQPFAYLIPLKYAINGLRAVMLRGVGLEGIYVDLVAMLVALAVTLTVASRSMGRE